MSFPFVLSAAVLLLALSDDSVSAGDFESSFRKEVIGFVSSLDEAQLAACLHDKEDQRRWEMRYTGGNRPGMMISQLDDAQRTLIIKMLSMVLSPEGWKMANAVAFQDAKEGGDALGKYWITCFGDPRKGDFAFRLAEHHLTIVHLELA